MCIGLTMFSHNPYRNQHYHRWIADASKAPWTLEQIVAEGTRLLRKAKIHRHFFGQGSLQEIATSLAFYALGLPYPEACRAAIFQRLLQEQEIIAILQLFERRISERIPTEYITGEAWYLGNRFYVNEHVLVPRSIMNTRFQDFLEQTPWQNKRVLDLCAGSGCIGITLALLRSDLSVDLLDISGNALLVAQKNVMRYDLQDRVRCLQSDLFEKVVDKYDLIISNPPYVSSKEYQRSPMEFHKEPKMALEAGKDGLSIIHRILRDAKSYLNPEGLLIVEVGYTAAAKIKKHYRQLPLQWFKYRRLSGQESFWGMHGVFLGRAKDLP